MPLEAILGNPLADIATTRVLKFFKVKEIHASSMHFRLEKLSTFSGSAILHLLGGGWMFMSMHEFLSAVSQAKYYNYISIVHGRQVGKSSIASRPEIALHNIDINPLHGFTSLEELLVKLDLLEAGNSSKGDAC